MKVAIYHNLEKGGAYNLLTALVKNINKKHKIDLYCHNSIVPKCIFNNIYNYKLHKTSNIFGHITQVLHNLKKLNLRIAKDINNRNYDLVLVFQCLLTSSPYLLRYLDKKTKSVYILNEPKREFYEKTTFDYYTPKKIVSRFIRLPLKFIDLTNCSHAKLIISNSYYSSNSIFKIFNKKSFVIYPGLEFKKPIPFFIKNNKRFISIGLYSKLKGHLFSLNQLKNISNKITILGKKTFEYPLIKNISLRNGVAINEIHTDNNYLKHVELTKHNFYLANNEMEPFGITTLEATNDGLFVLGKNQGGTSEIIKNGLNGILYPDNVILSRTELQRLLNIKYIKLYRISKINWENYTVNFMDVIEHYYA